MGCDVFVVGRWRTLVGGAGSVHEGYREVPGSNMVSKIQTLSVQGGWIFETSSVHLSPTLFSPIKHLRINIQHSYRVRAPSTSKLEQCPNVHYKLHYLDLIYNIVAANYYRHIICVSIESQTIYSETSDSGPSEIGTQYIIDLSTKDTGRGLKNCSPYRPVALIHFEPPKEDNQGQNS